MESKQALTCLNGKLKADGSKPGTQTVRGEVSELELTAPALAMRATRRTDVREVFTAADTRGEEGFSIRQTFAQRSNAAPDRVIFVVDGTEGMQTACASLSEAIAGLPTGTETGIVLAEDGVRILLPPRKIDSTVLKEAVSSLRRIHGTGGHDNVPALVQAWDFAAETGSGAVVWIHGPQPVALTSGEDLQQRFERRPDSPRFFDIQTQVGPNRIIEKLDGFGAVRVVPLLGNLEADLRRLFDQWKPAGSTIEVVRERIKSDADVANQGGKASLHLARLWGAQEVSRLTHSRKTDEAMRLARAYQLVTPVSGAVVLETQQQYTRAGLEPSPADTVPIVPEPSASALIIIGLVVWFVVRKRAARLAKSAGFLERR